MIIFLDFDGVLHPHVRRETDFCQLPQLWKILRACPDTKVVFSTSWREIYSPAEMVAFVASGEGKYLAHRVLGSTPSLERVGSYGRRDLEIQAWLDTNNHSGLWLALDDIPEIFCGQHPNLYVVDGNTGLTDADVDAIIQRIERLQLLKQTGQVDS